MGGHEFQDAFERAHADGMMMGHGDMELAVKLGGEADMGTVLPDAFVTEHPQGFDQVRSRDIPRGFHAARTSSRTKWSRITLGMGPGAPSLK